MGRTKTCTFLNANVRAIQHQNGFAVAEELFGDGGRVELYDGARWKTLWPQVLRHEVLEHNLDGELKALGYPCSTGESAQVRKHLVRDVEPQFH